MIFFLRRLLGTALTPSTAVCGILLFGALLLSFRRTSLWGRRLVITGVVALLLLSLGLPFGPIGRRLEARFPAVLAPAQLEDAGGIRWVVVLGGGQRAQTFLPVSAYPIEASLYRIVEGVRLHHALLNSRLLFSGSGGRDTISSASVGAELAEALGVTADQIVIDEAPRNTAEEAAQVRTHVGGERFVLVTSAVHMPRAVRIFQGVGLEPIPATTGHLAFERRMSVLDWIHPSLQRVLYADDVAHELLGLLAVRIGMP